MNKKTVIVGVCAVIVLLVIGGAWKWKNIRTSNQANTEIQKEEAKTEETGEVDTGDWKTYRNEEYGFEIEYPDFLQVKEYKASELKDSIFAVFFRKEKVGGITLEIKDVPFDPDNIIGIHGTFIGKEYIEERAFGDLKMYSYASGDAGCIGNVVYIPDNKKTITISVIDCADDEIKIRPVEDNILSSFRFIK